jgi:hypothetical protein
MVFQGNLRNRWANVLRSVERNLVNHDTLMCFQHLKIDCQWILTQIVGRKQSTSASKHSSVRKKAEKQSTSVSKHSSVKSHNLMSLD